MCFEAQVLFYWLHRCRTTSKLLLNSRVTVEVTWGTTQAAAAAAHDRLDRLNWTARKPSPARGSALKKQAAMQPLHDVHTNRTSAAANLRQTQLQ
jgi:hypothetical protein